MAETDAGFMAAGKRLPRPVKVLLRPVTTWIPRWVGAIRTNVRAIREERRRIRRRRAFAMGYYRPQLDFMQTWIPRDTESANFYYALTENNRDHLAQLVAFITSTPYETVVRYFEELEQDAGLREHIGTVLRTAGYGRDITVEYGRRLGWYAFVRATRPRVVVETGVDHGVGSCVLASALIRNAAAGYPGTYYGTDINPNAGRLFTDEYATVGKILYGDSIESLKGFNERIDLFINDSDHSADYEFQEYMTIADKLSERGLILGDNSHLTDRLSKFSRQTDRRFVFFSEKPAGHWYPGAGIGISFKAYDATVAGASTRPAV